MIDNYLKKKLKNISNKIIDNEILFRYGQNDKKKSHVSLLERDFAKIVGKKYCIAFNSCSTAIFTALKIFNIKPNSKVFIPIFTFAAVPAAAEHAGLKPITVNITKDLYIDELDFKNKILKHPECRTMILSYMRGHVPNIDTIKKLCKKHYIKVIEDCAHSLGVRYKGQQTGNFGEFSCFSTQSYKIIDGGEGGLLCTNNLEFATKAVLYSGSYENLYNSHFIDKKLFKKYLGKIPPYNFRMTALVAAILRPQLKYLKKKIKLVNRKFFIFKKIIYSKSIYFPCWSEGVEGVGDSLQFLIKSNDKKIKNKFLNDLIKQGIKASIIGISDNNARCYWNWNFFSKPMKSNNRMKNLIESVFDMRIDHNLSNNQTIEIATKIKNTIDRYF